MYYFRTFAEADITSVFVTLFSDIFTAVFPEISYCIHHYYLLPFEVVKLWKHYRKRGKMPFDSLPKNFSASPN